MSSLQWKPLLNQYIAYGFGHPSHVGYSAQMKKPQGKLFTAHKREVSTSKQKGFQNETNLHKNLFIDYAQALRGEGISSKNLQMELKKMSQA